MASTNSPDLTVGSLVSFTSTTASQEVFKGAVYFFQPADGRFGIDNVSRKRMGGGYHRVKGYYQFSLKEIKNLRVIRGPVPKPATNTAKDDQRSNPDGKKKRNTSTGFVKQGGSSNKDKAIALDEEDNDPVEIMSNKTAKRNYRRGNPSLSSKRTRTGKNPHKCPDIEDEDWGSDEDVQYTKWLTHEKGTRPLTRDQQAYFVNQGLSGGNLGNRKVHFKQ